MSALISGVSPATTARLGAVGTGLFVAGVAYVDMQRLVWRNAAEACRDYGTLQPVAHEDERFFGPKTRALFVRSWNAAVDGSLGTMAGELAKRGL